MGRRRKYTREVLEPLVRDSVSVAEVARRIGTKMSGSTQVLIGKRIREYGIDTSHFLGQSSNRGERHRGGPAKKHWSAVLCRRESDIREQAFRLRRALIEMGRPYRCESPGCSVDGVWLEREIRLNVDHVNGDFSDCRPENVRFLCPNCHSQTDGYSGSMGMTTLMSDAKIQRERRKRMRSSGGIR